MIPDLTKVTELFLLASSFLVAALGTADTNYHKAAVSLLGLVISLLWLPCSREALREAEAKQPGVACHMRHANSGMVLDGIHRWLVTLRRSARAAGAAYPGHQLT